MTHLVPNEVIIVEGRSDTRRLVEVFGSQIKTIETNGSAISRQLYPRIIDAQQRFGVIILTDPDYQGERIRRILTALIPDAKQAHVAAEHARHPNDPNKFGIEYVSDADLVQALTNVMTPQPETYDDYLLTQGQLMTLGLVGYPDSKARRERIANHFNLGHCNAKQLQKQLARYQITFQAVKDVLEAEEG